MSCGATNGEYGRLRSFTSTSICHARRLVSRDRTNPFIARSVFTVQCRVAELAVRGGVYISLHPHAFYFSFSLSSSCGFSFITNTITTTQYQQIPFQSFLCSASSFSPHHTHVLLCLTLRNRYRMQAYFQTDVSLPLIEPNATRPVDPQMPILRSYASV